MFSFQWPQSKIDQDFEIEEIIFNNFKKKVTIIHKTVFSMIWQLFIALHKKGTFMTKNMKQKIIHNNVFINQKRSTNSFTKSAKSEGFLTYSTFLERSMNIW